MKRIAPYIASATLGIALIASNAAMAQMIGGFGLDTGYPTYPSSYSRYGYPYGYASNPYNYSYPYNYSAYNYPYAYGAWNNGWGGVVGGLASLAAAPVEIAGAAVTAPMAVATNTAAPLMTGRSVATGQMGNSCKTSVKICELRHASYVGNGCSCRVVGARARDPFTIR